MWHIHEWTKWEEEAHNDRVWVHDKRIARHCVRCGESENKVIRIDCTHFRRYGKYCPACLDIINGNRKLAGVAEMVYNRENSKILNMAGRKPNIRMIRNVQRYRAQGLSFRAIAKKTKNDVHRIYDWAKYPLEKAEKRYKEARA